MNDGLCTYSWDGEGRMTSVGGTGCTTTSYTYDGDGKRMKKSSGKLYWYGMSGTRWWKPIFPGTIPPSTCSSAASGLRGGFGGRSCKKPAGWTPG
jgi:hypothetical protein